MMNGATAKKLIKSLITISMVAFALPLFAQDVQVQVQPMPVIVGEPAQLNLVSSKGFPQINQMPAIKGLTWLGQPNQSRQTQIINFKTTHRFVQTYRFRIDQEGEIKIPAIKAELKNKKVLINGLSLKAVKRKFLVDGKKGAKEMELKDLLFAKAHYLTERESFYIGEQIPLEIRIYSINGLIAKFHYPEIEIDEDVNVVFRDYSAINEYSGICSPYQRFNDKINDRFYVIHFCRSKLRPISAGELAGKATVKSIISVPRSRNSRPRNNMLRDAFFDDFFSRRFSDYDEHEYSLTAELPKVRILPLPPAPKTADFLGLVGDWDVKVELSSKEYKQGEPITLKIKIKGNGSLDALHAPKLDVPGFRMFPPEITRPGTAADGQEKAEIRYVMIPLQEGPMPIDLAVSTFSPKLKKYQEVSFNQTIKVAKGTMTAAVVSMDDDNPAPVVRKTKRGNGLLYLKKGKATPVQLPLWHNHAWLIILFLLAGPLVLGISELLYYRQMMFGRDPGLRRKMMAKKRKGKVLAALKKAAEGQVHGVINQDVVPYLNDLLDFPPGSSATELADKVSDPELSEVLHEAAAGAYLPGSSSGAELRKKLLKVLQKSFLIFALIGMLPLLDAADQADNPWASYDKGDFAKAAELFKQRGSQDQPDPVKLYNLGNCYYQLGELPQALVAFEQARRLQPRDSDIRENLNQVRRKLMLPEVGKTQHPLDILVNLRNFLRPDEWLLVLAAAWTAAGVILACRRRLISWGWICPLVLAVLVMLIALTAMFSQYATDYNADAALVVERGVPVYVLPSDNSRQAEFKLYAGEEVRIVEVRQDDWLRIRTENTEGWVKKNVITRVWPF